MATPIVITCPDCKKQMKVPETVRGKKVRCKECGTAVPVPAGRAPDTRVTTPEAQAKLAKMSEEEEALNPYGMTETSLAPRCPHCAYELDPPESLICLHCGYNMVKRQRTERKVTYERTFADWLLWLGPGFLAVLGIGVLVGLAIYFHFYLPFDILPQKDAESLMKDRMAAFEKDIDGTAYLFHPGIETFLAVACLALMWKCSRFAFKRLVLNYLPPEKIKSK